MNRRFRQSEEMAVAMRRWFDDSLPVRHRDSWWGKDDWLEKEWKDWPKDWPQPRDVMGKFYREPEHWWKDWPTDWPRMDAVMPRVTSHLDEVDRNWRSDPFWMDIYPRWAEPIFKEGIDVHSNITNDERKFAVDIDCYQFRPEEVQVKTLDDTLMIEGRHEDVRDRDNFTKMYFVRKYQIPTDVDITQIQSSIDARGRLSVEAPRRNLAISQGRERIIPIEGPGSRGSPRQRTDSGIGNAGYDGPRSGTGIGNAGYDGPRIGSGLGNYSSRSAGSPIQIQTGGDDRGREIRIDTNYQGSRNEREQVSHNSSRSDHRSRVEQSNGGGNGLATNNRLSPQDGYSTHSYSYHRSESRNRLGSPHEITTSNEQRAYGAAASPRRASFDTRDNINGEQRSPGKGVFDELRSQFERGPKAKASTRRFRSQSRGADYSRESNSRSESRNREYAARETSGGYGSDSRNGYRVESPASTTTGILRNGNTEPPRPESRTESVRSVQILRKTFG